MYAQNPGTGFTIWITGMQSAGKSALARELTNRLKRLEKPVELLEGPDWDVFIGKGPGGTKDERAALMRRAGFVARAITRAGGFAIVAQISPLRETRESLRREIGRFVEVFVDAPFDTLLSRDSSGQYKKALSGEIPNFVGVTDPYEPPTNPEVKVDSSKLTVDDEANLVMEALVREGVLEPSDIGLSQVPPEREEKRGRKPPEPILFSPEMLTMPKPSSKAEQAKAAFRQIVPGKIPPAAAKPAPAKAEAEKPAARTRKEAKAPAKPAPARARKAAAPVKAAKKVAAKTARAAKPAKKAAKPAKKAAAKKAGKKGKR